MGTVNDVLFHITPKEATFLLTAIESYNCEIAITLRQKIGEMKRHGERMTPEKFIGKVCQMTGITTEDMRSGKRNRRFSEPRACASQLIHDLFPELSLAMVGKLINKSHCTILHHYHVVRDVQEVNKLYKELKLKIVNSYHLPEPHLPNGMMSGDGTWVNKINQ